MTALVVIAKYGPKMEALGPGLVYHGTTWKNAKGIKKHGLKPGRYGTAFVAPDLETASHYASSRSGGKKGRVFVYKPSGPPSSANLDSIQYDPAVLGKPVHIQNTKKYTPYRLEERRKGIPPRAQRRQY